MPTDAELVRATRSGQRAAFAELVERYYPLLYGVALSSLRNRADAEDATQETFLRALNKLDTLQDAEKFGVWLSSIVRNVCRDTRARSLRESPLDNDILERTPAPAADSDPDELRSILWDYVMDLSTDEREILILYYFSKENTRAIAELLGVSIAAAEKRLQRARQALGDRMTAAVGEVIERQGPREKTKKAAVQAVLAIPVPWKLLPAPGSLVGAVTAAFTISGFSKLLFGITATVATIVGIRLWQEQDSTPIGVPAVASQNARAPVDAPDNGTLSKSHSAAHSTVSRKSAVDIQDNRPALRVIADNDVNAPVASAKVLLFTDGARTEIYTDQDGFCILDHETPHDAIMNVLHDEFLPLRNVSAAIGWNETKVVSLTSGDRIAGDVVDAATGQPIADFSILIEAAAELTSPKWRQGYVSIADPHGHFETRGVRGATAVKVVATGYALSYMSLQEGGVRLDSLRFELQPAYTLAISVTDEAGKPIQAASAEFSPGQYDEPRTELLTGSDGAVYVGDLQQWPTSVRIETAGYVPAEYHFGDEPLDKNITIAATLLRGHDVLVSVPDGSRPIDSLSLSLNDVDEGTQFSYAQYHPPVSKAEGGFVVSNVVPGVYTIYGRQSGTAQTFKTIYEIQPGQDHMEFRFPEQGGSIHGKVSVNGAPAAFSGMTLRVAVAGGEYTDWLGSGALGNFRFEGVPAGDGELWASIFAVEDETVGVSRIVNVVVPEGGSIEQNIDASGDAWLDLTVIEAEFDGKIMVEVFSGESEEYSDCVAWARCNVGETARIPALTPGHYSITGSYLYGANLRAMAARGKGPVPGVVYHDPPLNSRPSHDDSRFKSKLETDVSAGFNNRVELDMNPKS